MLELRIDSYLPERAPRALDDVSLVDPQGHGSVWLPVPDWAGKSTFDADRGDAAGRPATHRNNIPFLGSRYIAEPEKTAETLGLAASGLPAFTRGFSAYDMLDHIFGDIEKGVASAADPQGDVETPARSDQTCGCPQKGDCRFLRRHASAFSAFAQALNR